MPERLEALEETEATNQELLVELLRAVRGEQEPPASQPSTYGIMGWPERSFELRTRFAPITWLGRVLLWIVFFPIGIWRSLNHQRKKGARRTVKKVEAMLAERDGSV